MNHKKFSRFENFYFFAVFAIAFIYLYSVEENGVIDVGEQLYPLLFLGFLFFVGIILTTIKYSAKEGKVNKKAVLKIVGLILIFIILRVIINVAG